LMPLAGRRLSPSTAVATHPVPEHRCSPAGATRLRQYGTPGVWGRSYEAAEPIAKWREPPRGRTPDSLRRALPRNRELRHGEGEDQATGPLDLEVLAQARVVLAVAPHRDPVGAAHARIGLPRVGLVLGRGEEPLA